MVERPNCKRSLIILLQGKNQYGNYSKKADDRANDEKLWTGRSLRDYCWTAADRIVNCFSIGGTAGIARPGLRWGAEAAVAGGGIAGFGGDPAALQPITLSRGGIAGKNPEQSYEDAECPNEALGVF